MARAAGPDGYDGIPYVELPIDAIEWEPDDAEHIRTRVARKGQPREVDIEPEWATEAALDRQRVAADSGSKTGESIAVTGFSSSARMVLTVLLVPKEHPPRGDWWGATAWVANTKEERNYRKSGGGEEGDSNG